MSGPISTSCYGGRHGSCAERSCSCSCSHEARRTPTVQCGPCHYGRHHECNVEMVCLCQAQGHPGEGVDWTAGDLTAARAESEREALADRADAAGCRDEAMDEARA